MSHFSERALNYMISLEQNIKNRGNATTPHLQTNNIKTQKKNPPQLYSLDVVILVVLSTAILTALLMMFLFYINKPLKEQPKDMLEYVQIPRYNIKKSKFVKIQEELRSEFKELSTQQITPGQASLEMHWETPIMILNLESVGVVVPEFNVPIVEIILHHYNNVMEHNQALELSKGVADSIDFNRLFFDWQRDGGWKVFEHVVEFQKLTEFLQNFSKIWLTNIGYNQEFMNHQKMNLEIWASVDKNGNGNSYFGKIHENSLLSGVYYVTIPKNGNGGQLIFHDPRGPLPPFDSNRLVLKPRPGDVIIFPSWLVHQVTPALGEDEYISISWNIPGDWHTSTKSSITIPINIQECTK